MLAFVLRKKPKIGKKKEVEKKGVQLGGNLSIISANFGHRRKVINRGPPLFSQQLFSRVIVFHNQYSAT